LEGLIEFEVEPWTTFAEVRSRIEDIKSPEIANKDLFEHEKLLSDDYTLS